MAKPIIEMKDISYSYGQRNVIDHIHLTVEEGIFWHSLDRMDLVKQPY